MEKRASLPEQLHARGPAMRLRHARRIPVLLITSVISVLVVWSAYTGKLTTGGHICAGTTHSIAFKWDNVKASEGLIWYSCEGNFLCAKLTVPLDYADTSAGKAEVALMKLPSRIPPGHEEYRGPVLFNPGGPGLSGVDDLRRNGERYQKILGDDYDLIGFDSRGVGQTSPSLAIFKTEAERVAWALGKGPVMNATEDALARTYARGKILGGLVQERAKDVAAYMSTPLVARDMLSIVRAHGRDKLQYWGFSYGTVLGITFASMFPDHVERIVVDGVVDTYNYMQTQWSNNLLDTDKVMAQFYAACAAAGPAACALAEPTASGVKARLEALFTRLRRNPVPVPANASDPSDYGLVDYSLARNVLFQWTYSPFQQTPWNVSDLARALADVEGGDGRLLRRLAKEVMLELEPTLKCECGAEEKRPQAWAETNNAIACGDGEPVNDGFDDLQSHYERMAEHSSFAEAWAMRVKCAGWKVHAKEQYHGPFIGNTSHPIMLIGNTADPVTPLAHAHKMAHGFKDAVVLTQNSPGHCSYAATSLCTSKHIRAYFREGKLPPAGTVCETEDEMFAGSARTNKSTVDATLNAEDSSLLEAVRALKADFRPPYMHK